MATSGGPRLSGIGRGASGNVGLALDASVLASYPGDPTTNKSAEYDITLGQAYDWSNSGSFTRTNNVSDVPKPKGYEKANIYICRGVCTTTGSQHFAAGRCNVSASTRYTASVWYRQSKVGLGGPYMRGIVGNYSHGSLVWGGYDGKQSISGSGNWPANEWIRLFQYGTATSADETGMYISNYFGTTVGDTIWYFGPQFEAQTTMSPIVLNSTGSAAATSRGPTNGWKDLSPEGNNGSMTANLGSDQRNSKVGFNIFPTDHAFLDFDGTDDYVTTNFAPSGTTCINKTYSFWVTWTSGNVMFAVNGNWGGNTRIYLGVISGKAGFGFEGSGWNAADSSETFTADKWYNFTITIDGSGVARWYTNGEFRIQKSGSAFNTTQALTIGSAMPYSGSYWWNGNIASAVAYNKALSAQEVKENFNQQRSRYGI